MAVIDLKKLMSGDVMSNLVCPDNRKSIEFVDIGGVGLYLKCTKNSPGVGTYFLRYKNSNGVTAHEKLGRSTEISLDEARHKALQLKSDIARGNNPKVEAKLRTVIGFRDYALGAYMDLARTYKKSWPKDLGIINNYLIPLLNNKPLNKITRSELQKLHMKLKQEPHNLSNAMCNHVIKCARFIFSTAIQEELIEHNVLKSFRMYREDNRVENYLDNQQLRRLLFVLNNEKGKKIRMTCMVCLFLLATGARLNEALSSRWENIDRKNRLWLIPSSDSKSSVRRSVPLNDAAIDVLNQLGTEDDYEYLFVSFRSHTGEPLRSIARGWSSLRKKAGLEFLRIHDLRHNHASMLVNNGVSIYSVSQVLGHSSVIVTQRYAHLSTKTLQDASQNAARCINAAMASNL